MKTFIKNRDGENISVLIEESSERRGLVFLMHGMGYNKEEVLLRKLSNFFHSNGFSVISFDTTSTFGESDGEFENATTTKYYEDLEDIVDWAKTQLFYQEPFSLVGHSLGGLCTINYATNNPEKVKTIIPISTVVSGELTMQTYSKEILDFWKENGILEWQDDGKTKRMKWDCMEDGLKYDILKQAEKIACPTLLISAENDQVIPCEQQKILYDKLICKKGLRIIPEAKHLLREESDQEIAVETIGEWLEELGI